MRPLSVLALLCSLALSVCAGEALETWIISGQSNACGRAQLPGAEPDARVEMFDGRKWVQAQEPLPLGGSVGPWLMAATQVAKAGVRVRLTGQAAGGMPISYWDEKKAGHTALFNAIKQAGQGADVFLWYQGESDGKEGMDQQTYQAKLEQIVAAVRSAAKNPSLLVVIIQLGSWKNKTGDFQPIREAQRQFVIKDPKAILVPALGRDMGDYVHLSKEGYFELGHELSRALLKVHHKDKQADWPGPVMDAAVAGGDGTSAVVHFAEVKKLSGALAEDFGAVDADGVVKCTKAEAQKTRVALSFERALKRPAKIIYGVGQLPKASLVDEAGNRAPAVQLDLTSGKLPEDAETQAANGAGKTLTPGKPAK